MAIWRLVLLVFLLLVLPQSVVSRQRFDPEAVALRQALEEIHQRIVPPALDFELDFNPEEEEPFVNGLRSCGRLEIFLATFAMVYFVIVVGGKFFHLHIEGNNDPEVAAPVVPAGLNRIDQIPFAYYAGLFVSTVLVAVIIHRIVRAARR